MKLLRALLLTAVLLVPGVHVFAQPVPPIDQPIELKVMTFNIWLGGNQVNIGKVVEAIEAANADVVGLQEAVGNERRIAEALG